MRSHNKIVVKYIIKNEEEILNKKNPQNKNFWFFPEQKLKWLINKKNIGQMIFTTLTIQTDKYFINTYYCTKRKFSKFSDEFMIKKCYLLLFVFVVLKFIRNLHNRLTLKGPVLLRYDVT